MKNRTCSIPNNRYDRYLNELSDRAWNCMSKTGWDHTLYKFGRARFGKSDDDEESTNDESVNESVDDEPVNKFITDELVDELITNEPVNEPI